MEALLFRHAVAGTFTVTVPCSCLWPRSRTCLQVTNTGGRTRGWPRGVFALVTSWGPPQDGHRSWSEPKVVQTCCPFGCCMLLRFRRGIDYDDMILAKPDLEGKEQQWVSHRGWKLFVPSKSLPDMLVYLLVGTLCVMTVYVVVVSSHLGFGDWKWSEAQWQSYVMVVKALVEWVVGLDDNPDGPWRSRGTTLIHWQLRKFSLFLRNPWVSLLSHERCFSKL